MFDALIEEPTLISDHQETRFVRREYEREAERKLSTYRKRANKPPNFLVIVMDDVGWGDFGCYGGGVAVGAATPNIDRLAQESVRLTSCYSEPSCSPSRATLMTGRLPCRHGLLRPPMYGERGGLEGEITLANLLSNGGYRTQAVGKWHMGEARGSQPQDVGFDDFYGFLSVSDMYTEWRDPYFFPEIVNNAKREEWIKNRPFNKCFVHATAGQDPESIEEVTIPVLSTLDDKWCKYSEKFIRAQTESDKPWLLYHCTRGAHFDNYPSEEFAGKSAARYPYKDAIVELDSIVGRLVHALDETDQRSSTVIFVTSDNGPEAETWPDAAYTPFRCAKGSTWEGGVRVPALLSWTGMVPSGRISDGLFSFCDLLPTTLRLSDLSGSLPADRYIDGVDQASFLLSDQAESNRKFHFYWLGQVLSAIRGGEFKFMLNAISDQESGLYGAGGFTGVAQRFPYGRFYNLYLDPKEEHSFMIRKLAYISAFQDARRLHLNTFKRFPSKLKTRLNM